MKTIMWWALGVAEVWGEKVLWKLHARMHRMDERVQRLASWVKGTGDG